MIELRDVSKVYKLKNNKLFNAVDSVDLIFNNEDITGIVGYSGAGKSTLVRLINGLIKPTSGTVIVDGININNIDNKELNKVRHNMGMIFQNYNLLSSLTVKDNVVLSLKIANYSKDKLVINNRALEVLELVGLSDKVDEFPKNLSGGQKQRVAIARAIANNPKYLLCDEITSALDNKTALEIVQLLKLIKEKTSVTIVFISHQLEIVRSLCDRVVVMEDGIVVEDDKTVNLFLNPKSNASKQLMGNIFDFSKHKDKYLLKYSNDANNKTILSDGIIKYGVLVNILEAQTYNISNTTIGFLIVDIVGPKKEMLINYLNENDIEVELI